MGRILRAFTRHLKVVCSGLGEDIFVVGSAGVVLLSVLYSKYLLRQVPNNYKVMGLHTRLKKRLFAFEKPTI